MCSAKFCDEHDLGPHLSSKHGISMDAYEAEFGAQERAGITTKTSPGDRVLVMSQTRTHSSSASRAGVPSQQHGLPQPPQGWSQSSA